MLTGPKIASPAFLKITVSTLSLPVSLTIVFGSINPSWSAAAAVIGLNTDPVG